MALALTVPLFLRLGQQPGNATLWTEGTKYDLVIFREIPKISGSCGFVVPPAEEYQLAQRENLATYVRSEQVANHWTTISATSRESTNISSYLDDIAAGFKNLTDQKSFVDKTGLLRLLRDELHGHALFVQAPLKFGKSTNLGMAKTFFEIPIDKSGKIFPDKYATENYRIFAKQPAFLRTKLDILEDRDFIWEHFGEYPVVLLDFKKLNPIPFSEAGLARTLFDCWVGEIDRHKYIIPPQMRVKCEMEPWRCFVEEVPEDMKTLMLMTAGFLNALHSYYYRLVLILIDELDFPMRKLIMEKNPGEADFESLSKVFSHYIEFLLNDSNVRFAFMTGIISTAVCLPWRPYNVRRKSVFFDRDFAPFYGLTEKEVEDLCVRYGRPNELSKMKMWYGGYHTLSGDMELFNIISVVEFLERNELRPYWIRAGPLPKLSEAFRFERLGKDVWRCLQNESVEAWLRNTFTLEEIIYARETFNKKTGGKLSCAERDSALQYLFENGFFSSTDYVRGFFRDISIDLGIPNEEVRRALSERVWEAAKDKYRGLASPVQEYWEAVESLNGSQSSYRNLVNKAASILKMLEGSINKEDEFKCILYAFYKSFPTKVHVELRIDAWGIDKMRWCYWKKPVTSNLIVLRKNPLGSETFTGIVFELKFGTTKIATDALNQILGRHYSRTFKEKRFGDKNITDYFLIGIRGDEKNNVITGSILHNEDNLELAVNVTSELKYS